VGLVGVSGGTIDTLGAAARGGAVSAVAICDPLAFEVLDEADKTRLDKAIERMAGLAGKGELIEAARDWMTEWANEAEMAALSESGYLEACAKYVPVLLHMLEHAGDADEPGPTDPSVLRQITAPVLLLASDRSSRVGGSARAGYLVC
jgi:hypothetical protein